MTDAKSLAIIPRTVEEARILAAMFAKSSLLPEALRGKEADVFVSIVAGQELGLPPMAALRGVHVVKGKPVLSADTMVGVVLGRGVADYFSCIEETNTSVTYETKRHGSPQPQRCTWTLEDAKRANLNGDNWTKYPRAMLKARCKAMLARDVYPDVLAGCYDDDEAREFSGPSTSSTSAVLPRNHAPNADVPDAEMVSESSEPSDTDKMLIAIDEADTVDALKALVPKLTKLDGEAKKEGRRRYSERMKELTSEPGAEG